MSLPVVDTIKLTLVGCTLRCLPILPNEWTRRKHDPFCQLLDAMETFYLIHVPTKMRVSGRGRQVHTIEVELPRVLFGHNGNLISSAEELGTAIARVSENLAQIALAPISAKLQRVDLVWQFKGDPQRFIAAHKHSVHPCIKKLPRLFPSESLQWKGQALTICMYDKLLKHTKKAGTVIRVEFQIRGKRLLELLNTDSDALTVLDFQKCYACFRRLLLGFAPKPVCKPTNLAEFLSIGLREGWKYGGQDCFEILTSTYSHRHKNRLAKQISAARPETFDIRWEELAPLYHTPPVVNVTLPSRFIT